MNMMKNKNILKQEEEFLKMNQEIDLKTKDLLSQVDQVKEILFSNEKLFWEASESNKKTETLTQENDESNTINKSTDDDFVLKEYLSIRKYESTTSIETEDGNNQQKKVRQFLKPSHSAKLTPSLVGAPSQDSLLSLGITRHKSDIKAGQGKIEDDVIPETLKGAGHDGIMRFLSAKVKLLTQQLEVVKKDEKKHVEKIKELQAFKDKSIEEREKLIQQTNSARSTLIKYEQHTNNMSTRLQTVLAENSNLKKELETLKKEIRQNNKNHNSHEIKLNRTLEEVEKLKASLQQAKQEEKEFKEFHRKKTEDLTNTIKKLDRQRTELLNGFKKQLLLIDNLKRQKSLIDIGKLLNTAEDDFVSFLDSNPPNTTRSSEAIKPGKSVQHSNNDL